MCDNINQPGMIIITICEINFLLSTKMKHRMFQSNNMCAEKLTYQLMESLSGHS